MKKFLVAMMLAVMPSVANASVTITFGGIADLGSYTRTVSSTNGESFVNDSSIPTVSGTLAISLGLLTNQSGSSVYYDASGAAFLSGSFASSGVTPFVLSGGTPSHFVQREADGTGTIELSYFDTAAIGSATPYSSRFTLFGSDVPLTTIGGIQLPDFANAKTLFFSLSSLQGGEFDYVESYSAGTVTSVAVTGPEVAAAIPEPATWAMLILGFGTAGATLRRRRPAHLAAV